MFTVTNRSIFFILPLLVTSIVCSELFAGPPPYCYEELDGSPSGCFKKLKVSNGALTDNGDGSMTLVTGVGGGGDFSSNTATSVDGEIVLFSGAGGKTGKRATTTGILKGTSGVLSAAVAGTDYYNPGGTDVAVADGGTGASNASGARTNLGLAIGTDVQAYDADLTTYAGITPSANIQTFLGAANYAAMRTQLGLVIGTNVEAWDADLDSWAAITRASGFDTFTATPSSANLASLLTDEVGNAGGFTRGTAGASNDCVKWDASGNLVSAGAACGGAGGTPGGSDGQLQYNNAGSFGGMSGWNWDSVGAILKANSSVAKVNWEDVGSVNVPNTVYSGSGWNGSTKAVSQDAIRDWLESSQWLQSAGFNWTSVPDATIPKAKTNWSSFWVDATSGINWNEIPGAITGYVLKKTSSGVNWQSDLTAAGGSGAKIMQLNPYSAKLSGSFVTATITNLDAATQGAQIDAGDGNWRVLFDATTDEAVVFYGILPDNYTSTPVVKLLYSMTSATTGKVEFETAVMCVTPGDSADVGTASFASGATDGGLTVPGTAGFLQSLDSITPTDDSCAAGDLIYVYVSTDANDGTNDDATGDRELVGAYLAYT